MSQRFYGLSIVVVAILVGAASAVTIETVPVGDAGNAGDTRYPRDGVSSFGSVTYTYNIGKYEVTVGQYAEFLNAVAKTDTYGLYNSRMWTAATGINIQQSGTSGDFSYSVVSGYANRPVAYVSFWDACRFANWLNNGQGSGDTETGAYTLNGYNLWDGRTIQRNAGATWAVTSEDEWYKAAYYKGGSTNAGYWDCPTSSDDINPTTANYWWSDIGFTTDVGSFGNPSPYGTFDQGGNVWEWTEAVAYSSARALRGGGYGAMDVGPLLASGHFSDHPADEGSSIGFRVVQLPEPATIVMLALASMVRTRRKPA